MAFFFAVSQRIQPVPHGSSTEAVEMPERQTTVPTSMQMSHQSLQPWRLQRAQQNRNSALM